MDATTHHERIYKHNFEQCEAIGRRIGVLLAQGNMNGAVHSLKYSIANEIGDRKERLGELSIAQLTRDNRTANIIEEALDATFVQDLVGVSVEQLTTAMGVRRASAAHLLRSLESLGIPFPIPHAFPLTATVVVSDFEAPKLPDPNPSPSPLPRRSEPMSIIDAILNADSDQIKEVDEEIKQTEARLAKLKRARKLLAGINGSSSSGSPAKPLGPRVIAYLKEHGPSTPRATAEALGVAVQAINMSVTRQKEIVRDGDNNILLSEDES